MEMMINNSGIWNMRERKCGDMSTKLARINHSYWDVVATLAIFHVSKSRARDHTNC